MMAARYGKLESAEGGGGGWTSGQGSVSGTKSPPKVKRFF